MKKQVMACAVLAAIGGVASAQSAVAIYGLVDVGVVAESGGSAGSVTKLTSGVSAGSRIGFKGTEDLGGGASALFLLESGFQADTGAMGQGGLLFGRQAYVGLNQAGYGTVTLGRQYTPEFMTLFMADPFATAYAGSSANLMALTGSGGRTDNTVKYASPAIGGVTGEFAYTFGEVAGSSSTNRQVGAAVGYAAGPLAVRLGYHNRNNDTATVQNPSARNTLLAATYNFGVLKGHFAYGIAKGLNSSALRSTNNPFGAAVAPSSSTDSTELLVGATVPFGQNALLVSYIRKDDTTALNQDANQMAVGYRYALSKRTDLYTSYARISNRNGAGYTVGSAIEPGSGDKAFNMGVRHTF